MLNYRMREGERAYFPRPEGMSPTLHALLIQRGIATAEQAEEFLHPSASRLRDPMLLSDMGPATAAIRAAMENGEPICVYGDYDVDGVSASAILAGYLRAQGAKAEVYRALHQLASEGKAIIMVSSELPEIIGVSDRILVMCEGRITAELQNENLQEDDVIRYAFSS